MTTRIKGDPAPPRVMDIALVQKFGEEVFQRAQREAEKRAAEVRSQFPDDSSAYTAIATIPTEMIVGMLFGWEYRKGHFSAPGSTKAKACFKSDRGNFLVHGGTDHIPPDHAVFYPFELVKTVKQFDNAQTFSWFKEHFPKIAEISRKELAKKQAKSQAKKPKKNPKEEEENDEEELAPPAVFEVCKVPYPSSPISFEEWRRTIQENFPILVPVAEAGASLVCQLLIHDITNCGALVLVDVPSTGKTITINFFNDIEGLTYASDTFTPASFVSNAAKVPKKQLYKIDLLPRIRRKMFLVRDMATIFSERDDDLMKNMGILTRVFDGEGLSTDTGIHGRRALRGDYTFMFLAASTPLDRRVWKAMGTLGQRLFFLGLHSPDKSEQELADQLRNPSYKSKELECRHVTQDFLYTLWNKYPEGVTWDSSKDPPECLTIISRCAMLLARLRGQVKVWKEDNGQNKEDMGFSVPIIEKPDRINQCLYNFARGHALAVGRTTLTMEDMQLVVTLACDSAPGHRATLFRELITRGGAMRTQEVETFLSCSNPTALKEMKALGLLGICEEKDGDAMSFDAQKRITLKNDLRWFLSDECKCFLKLNTGSETVRDTSKEI